ncbi:MAG: hypothetical protein Q9200_007087, partial [Gallowayella weberi]
MLVLDVMAESQNPSSTQLPFPPVTRSHILHCSYHHWRPKYRSITPKARLIPLTAPFLAYLRSDGIILPPDPPASAADLSSTDTDSGIFSSNSTSDTSDAEDSDAEDPDPSTQWPEIHAKITSTIAELGGNIIPKLNWSAPKDATWINATNSMECKSANDVYLLLKSSDFITHDLEQVFDDCEPLPRASLPHHNDNTNKDPPNDSEIPYNLILRKTIPALVPSLEFRAFIRNRTLLCICQRDLNHYAFLPDLIPTLRPLIQNFFEENLKTTFEDENFVVDVYIPPPHQRVWLIDINPWAPRTDPLLFSWMEILEMSPLESPSALSPSSRGGSRTPRRGEIDDGGGGGGGSDGSVSDGVVEEED